MKKKYSLDYTIERDIDRLEAVNQILNTLDKQPSPTDLEQMASYILYGKDEQGKNAIQRGETTDSDKRYKSFLKAADKVESLDEILENPLSDQTNLQSWDTRYIYTKKKPEIRRPKYDKVTGEMIDPGDSEIPGMVELWERIDYLEKVLAANEGKIEFDDTMSVLQDTYRIYKLRHMIIDLRKHQYYLKDSVKPTLHFVAIQPPKRQSINWDSDAAYWMTLDEWHRKVDNNLNPYISKNLDDYETRTNEEGNIEVRYVVRHHHFDWENPKHVRALIDHYSSIYMELYDDLHSWGRTLIADFNRYYEMCDFSPVREWILTRKIDKVGYPQIRDEIQEKFGISYNETHVCAILNREIPEKIATAAKKYRLELETPLSKKKQCFRCKKWFPRDDLFFGKNKGRKDNLASNCKECEKKRRISRGQSEYDRRSKDA